MATVMSSMPGATTALAVIASAVCGHCHGSCCHYSSIACVMFLDSTVTVFALTLLTLQTGLAKYKFLCILSHIEDGLVV